MPALISSCLPLRFTFTNIIFHFKNGAKMSGTIVQLSFFSLLFFYSMEFTFVSTLPQDPFASTLKTCSLLDRSYNYTQDSHQWLFFRDSRWTPFDAHNQFKLFETLQMNGKFVDLKDSHFPGVERLRVFPASNYVSYLGTRYNLSHILLPRF